MLWFIAIVATITLGLAIAIYRRPAGTSDDAAMLEVAKQINELASKLTTGREKIEQQTGSLAEIEKSPEGGNV